MNKNKNRRIGPSFDKFLEDEGILEVTTEVAVKRILAWQVAQAMKRKHISKIKMAKKMGTSRSLLDRFLDPNDTSVTLMTMSRAANAVGKNITISLVGRKAARPHARATASASKQKSSRRSSRV
jgi:hypothetical protein